jgi:hypothetical protein
MFRMVFPSIISSPRLYVQCQVYVIQVCWLLASGPKMELHLGPASKQLTLSVQSRTPDDGRKDCSKHVEWYSVNLKNCASSWFYYRKIHMLCVKHCHHKVSHWIFGEMSKYVQHIGIVFVILVYCLQCIICKHLWMLWILMYFA